MNSLVHGNDTSAVEITHISLHGIWLLAHGKEHFLSYDDFPWFKDQTVRAIHHVEEPVTDHYYWPELDIDLTRKMIENPEQFPLKAKTN
jgi:hypothetical protein